MRKFIATGIAALSALTITVGTAGIAHAANPPTIVSQVCGSLPGPLGAINSQQAAGAVSLATANADLVSKEGAMNTSVATLVAAIAAQVVALSGNLDTVITSHVLSDAVSSYSAKVTAWSSALTVRDNASRSLSVTGISQTVLSTLQTALACP